MSISMIRRVDGLGRLVLPEEMRREMLLQEGAAVRLTLDGGVVTLEKEAPQCVFCGALEHLAEKNGRMVCAECAGAMAAIGSGGPPAAP